MSYIGSTPTTQSFISGTDYFNGDGSTTAFTLTRTVASVNDIEAVVNNVVQQPNSAYNISGTTITFTSAPSAGTGNVYVRYLSTTTQSITPSQNTVAYSTFNTDMQGLFGQSFTNRIFNGQMQIDQRNAGASVSNTGATIVTLDRWKTLGTTSAGVFSIQQVSDAPAGFGNSLKVTVTTADASLAATDRYDVLTPLEGYSITDFNFGTASATSITLSFWAKSSVTGTFGGAVSNGASTRSYPYSYTISAANTWEYKTITIPGDTTGTWETGTNRAFQLLFCLGAGSDYQGTVNTWASANYHTPTGATNLMATGSATWQVTGVQLEKGSTATSFDYRPYGTELQLCQRYYEKYLSSGETFGLPTAYVYNGAAIYGRQFYQVEKRAAPTITFSSTGNTLLECYATGAGSGLSYSGTIAAEIVNTKSFAWNQPVSGISGGVAVMAGIRTGQSFQISAEL